MSYEQSPQSLPAEPPPRRGMSRVNKLLILGLVVIVAVVAGIAAERFLASQTQEMFDQINQAMTTTPRPAAPVAPRAPEGTGAAGNVCYLVTDAEIEQIMGRPPIGSGSGFELGGVRSCLWLLFMDPSESAYISVSRAVNHDDGRIFDWEPVTGIGEDAYWVTSANLESLYVKKGAYSLVVSAESEGRDQKTAAIEIGRLAASRLP